MELINRVNTPEDRMCSKLVASPKENIGFTETNVEGRE